MKRVLSALGPDFFVNVTRQHFLSGHLTEPRSTGYDAVPDPSAFLGYRRVARPETDQEYIERVADDRKSLVDDVKYIWSDSFLYELFRNMSDFANEYWQIESGGNAYINLERVIERSFDETLSDARFLVPIETYKRAGVWNAIRKDLRLNSPYRAGVRDNFYRETQ